MMRFDWFLYVLVVSATCVGFTAKAYACSCLVGTREKEFEVAAAVFEGQVTSVAPRPEVRGSSGKITEATLKVVQAWKGIQTQQTTVLTPASASECGMSFEVGKSYLIYAKALEGSNLGVTTCSRTRKISEAQGDIRAMGMGSVPVDPKLTPSEKKAYATPASPRPRPTTGCAGCQVGVPGGSLPPLAGFAWMVAGVFFWCFVRRSGTAVIGDRRQDRRLIP